MGLRGDNLNKPTTTTTTTPTSTSSSSSSSKNTILTTSSSSTSSTSSTSTTSTNKPNANKNKNNSKRHSSGTMSKKAERRLVEYFVIVSSIPRNTPNNNNNEDPKNNNNNTSFISIDEESLDDNDFQPVITARYPLEDHEDNPLHDSVTCFCHPTGSIRLRSESSMPKVHYFVSTGGEGQQVYGTCLTTYEPYLINSKNMINNTEDNNNEEEEEEDPPKKLEVFLPKCLCILSAYPYLVAFREFLTQLHRLSKMGDMPLPVERYILNFCAEIPAPPPGSFEVQTTILDSTIKIWSPPHNLPIVWVSLPFSHLFECLDLDNIMQVWHALALERQVLLTSTQLSLLTTCSEIFTSLLFPMRWSHAYIPVVPHFLIPILSAPMPYLCGIDKNNLSTALYDLSGECLLVDLDKNQVTLGPNTPPLPPLPHHLKVTLREKLEENVGGVFREARSLTKNDDYSERGLHLPDHVRLMADAMWESRLCLFDEAFHLMFTPDMERKDLLNGNDGSGIETTERDLNNPTVPIRIMTKEEKQNLRKQSKWDAVQEAFLDTYVFILRNYRKFLVFPSKEHEGAYGGAAFRSEEFVDSHRADLRSFLKQLVDTQMFDDFVTKRLYGSGEADVAFFDKAVDRFFKNSSLISGVTMAGRGIRRARSERLDLTSGRGRGRGRHNPNSPPENNPVANVAQVANQITGSFRRNSWHRQESLRNFFSQATASASGTKPKPPPTMKKSPTPTSSSSTNNNNGPGPLIQSARVHRKLKTIVPPEPSGADLPPPPPMPSVPTHADVHSALDDDVSVGSASTAGTQSTRGTGLSSTTGRSNSNMESPSNRSGRGSGYRRRHEQLASELEKEKGCYYYPVFPGTLDEGLFGKPRPLPSAVLAEFDRQRQDAAKFRRNNAEGEEVGHLRKGHKHAGGEGPTDKPPSAEVATFTVFFMAFTAVVGKDLLEISNVPMSKAEDRTILATYTHGTETDSDDEDTKSVPSSLAFPTDAAKEDATASNNDDEFFDADDEASSSALPDEKNSTDTKKVVDVDLDTSFDLDGSTTDQNKTDSTQSSSPSNLAKIQPTPPPRHRFKHKLSDLQIQEAKATAKAQLGLAFEMLTIMKKRGLKADPASYQCLIDACGRCGDTGRATQLLPKMHDDGIVADGVVYSWLVSAFSAEKNSMKKISGKTDEDLPQWANGASVDMDWNKLQKRSYIEIAKERFGNMRLAHDPEHPPTTTTPSTSNTSNPEDPTPHNPPEKRQSQHLLDRASALIRKTTTRNRLNPPLPISTSSDDDSTSPVKLSMHGPEKKTFVTEPILRQILLGENLLEVVYPDISIDTDNELCPRCNTLLTDDDVVFGWSPLDPQDYTTKCPICAQKFVPHFCVQSTSASFVGSRGAGTPLLCERLSPWVLQKELRSVMSDREGIEDLLSPEWRDAETKNAVLWWNLILSFMRYRFPFSFLLQGSFDTNLIAPTPVDDMA